MTHTHTHTNRESTPSFFSPFFSPSFLAPCLSTQLAAYGGGKCDPTIKHTQPHPLHTHTRTHAHTQNTTRKKKFMDMHKQTHMGSTDIIAQCFPHRQLSGSGSACSGMWSFGSAESLRFEMPSTLPVSVPVPVPTPRPHSLSLSLSLSPLPVHT